MPSDLRQQRAAQEAKQIVTTPFDLTQGPLLRVAVIRIDGHEHHLIVAMHHIISDAWSNRIIIDELAVCYRACLAGQSPQLPELPVQYADYAIWQRNWLEAGEKERQLAYWRAQLGDTHKILQLPVDHARLPVNSYCAAHTSFQFPAPLASGLRRLAQERGVTLFMVLLCGFQMLLYRYSGQNDIRVGVPVANRHRTEAERIVGLFVNTQVLCNRIDSHMTLAAILGQVRDAALGAQAHQDLPFEQLVEALQPERSLHQNPLFQVMFNHLREDYRALYQLPGLTVSEFEPGERSAQFELVLDTVETPDGQIAARFTYAAELFEADTIQRLSEHYLCLLQHLSDDAQQCLGDVNLLSTAEWDQLLKWGVNEQRYAGTAPVHHLIERRVEEQLNAIALIFQDKELSYAHLNRCANRLAHRLIALGVKPESRVGIALERSIEMVVSLLAVLKAGGTYVPLDPDYPSERLQHMITDSDIGLLLTQSHVRAKIPCAQHCPVLELDTETFADYPEDNPSVALHPEHLAYIIYTSGSTGKPKGVAVAHGPLAMHVQSIGELYGMTSADRELQFASINFDGAHERWLVPLAFGATLMPRDYELWAAERTASEIAKHRITIACFTPSYLQQLAEFAGNGGRNLPIRSYTAGGEAMSRSAFEFVQQTLQPPRIINGYGPTETVITPLIFKAYSDTRFDSSYLPIGSPVGDRTAYIVDTDMNPVPVGVPGELYLGGVGLARGYLNRPGLTAERFVADPFSQTGDRLYRTGDLARWRRDGQVEYLGRLDHQVKIRGFRIELGEIEAQLLRQPAVREAVAAIKEGPHGARLIAYAVLHEDRVEDGGVLRESLAHVLPDYMLPSTIMILDHLPLNASGKVDRDRLPQPEFTHDKEYEVPQTEVENILADIWAQVLDLSRVGRHDNFFEIGGDSILSLQIVTKTRRAGWKITPRQLFECQTISALAQKATPVETSDQAALQFGRIDDLTQIPLLPVQRDFFAQLIPVRSHWNQAVLLKCREKLQADWLRQAITTLVQRHRALCFRFDEDAHGFWQQTASTASQHDYLWVRQAEDEAQFLAICNAAQRNLNLQQGLLLHTVLIDWIDNTQRLLLVIHHTVIDGVSWRIVVEDLEMAYRQAARQNDIDLPGATTDYAVWSRRLMQYPLQHESEFDYWQNLKGIPVTLPCDFPQGANDAVNRTKITVMLDQQQTRALLKDAPSAYRTQVNDLLLTALAGALRDECEQQNIIVDLEGHGREDLFRDIDLSRSVGWYTTVFPVMLDADGNLPQRIMKIKEQLREIPNKGIGYGLFKYHGSAQQRQIIAALPQARVVFNYLGQLDASFTTDSLWQLADEPVGDLIDPGMPQTHDLAINCYVTRGELCIDINFSSARHVQTAITALGHRLLQELGAIIAHCTSGVSVATPSDFSLVRVSQSELNDLPVAIERIEDLYPLSPLQTGILFHSVFETDSRAYVNQLRANIMKLSVARFREAWQTVVNRHSILRTGFLTEGQVPLQWVAKTAILPFTEYDWRHRAFVSQHDVEVALDALAQSELLTGFRLDQPPLIKIVLVHCCGQQSHMILTLHHLLLDGWSTSQLLGEVLRIYSGEKPPLAASRYRDFIEWLSGRDTDAAEHYWKKLLHTITEPTRLVSSSGKLQADSGFAEYTHVLESELISAVSRFAVQQRITLNTLIQAAWALVLKQRTGQSQITFGITVAGRPAELPDADHILGLFINTLPVVITFKPEWTVGQWLHDLQLQNLTSREHEQAALYEIQRWSGYQRTGLFDSIVVFEDYPVDATLQQHTPGGLTFSGVKVHETTHYPMTVSVIENDGLILHFGYACAEFEPQTIASFAEKVEQLLREMIIDANRRLSELTLLSDAEWQQLQNWGINTRDHDAVQPVHRLIEHQAALHPDAAALILGDRELSYKELNIQANRLAHHLIAFGIRPEQRIGIALDRSFEMIIALLATLKAGAAYVPLDPDYPRERLAHIAQDSGIALLLTHGRVRTKIEQAVTCPIVELDASGFSGFPAHDPNVVLHMEHLAYVIYTSGSTGKPKGVGVAHHALAEHAQAAAFSYGLRCDDRILQFSTINFDAFIDQLFPALCNGAAVVLRDSQLWDVATFYRELHDKRITIADLTTAYWSVLLSQCDQLQHERYSALRHINVGGESMLPESLQKWHAVGLDHIRLFNVYGPTEAVVTATAFDCRDYRHDERQQWQPVAIGKPLPSRRIYILDDNLLPVACGQTGELCIGGELLARGYLEQPGLTATRFIADPFDGKGGRLYRTGDLARWHEDGQIEYLGRWDHQVKIRGYRVELGEIETHLLSLPQVRQAVVLAQAAASGTRLVAYLTLFPDESLTVAEIRAALSSVLPDYMLPAAFVILDQLPLDANGKIDRKRLPQAEFSGVSGYELAQGEVEVILAGIWQEVLGVKILGRYDNFFELGGDSILSLQIVSKAHQAGWKITPRQLFEKQTVAALALVAENIGSTTIIEAEVERAGLDDYLDAEMIASLGIRKDRVDDVYPLSPTQEGMLFHTLETPGTGLYVNQISVTVDGLDTDRMEQAWQHMIDRHAVLRTGLLWRSGLSRPLQMVFRSAVAEVVQLDWQDKGNLQQLIAAYAETELKRELDFLHPPLARLCLIRIGENRHQLIWTHHHILFDGWSHTLLIRDWLDEYYGKPLRQAGPDYGLYIRWLEKQPNQAAQQFWKSELAQLEGPTLLAQAVRQVAPRNRSTDFALLYTRWDVDETDRLKDFVQRHRITLNTFVQAAWALLLQRYCNKETVVFGATVAGRPLSLAHSDEMIGLFINTIPVPVPRRNHQTVAKYLRALQETNVRLRDFEHTALANIQRWAGYSGQPLFDSIVVFENYPIDATLRNSESDDLRFGVMQSNGMTGYAMDLQVVIGTTLEIEYAYSCNDFTESFVQNLRSHMESLMREMMIDALRPVGELSWVDQRERVRLLSLRSTADFSLVTKDYHPVHRLIERNAAVQPDAIALLLGEQEMSYAELNLRANGLAHELMQLGAVPETCIGVAMERSLDVIVVFLAILKTGAAYVPLDIDYPTERLQFMIKDSRLSLLITQRAILTRHVFDSDVPQLVLEDIDRNFEHTENPVIAVHQQQLAYVIYTSGSTGLPKGVGVTHGPLSMHCQATAKIYEMHPGSCELLFMSFSFDGAHERWLTALTVGAGLAVRDQELWTVEQTYDALHHYGITNAAFPPAYLSQIAEWASSRTDPPPVELYVFGGEAMPKASYDLIRQALRSDRLINGYGPTETVVTPLIWKTDTASSFDCAYAPIGRPVGDRTVYVLDTSMQLVPDGVVGELYIGGYGLARGYLGRAGLTAERFVADPFNSAGGRLYRTGDLVRWLNDGNIEYVGRADDQVKIRGFRIELGEIEARIRVESGVTDVAIVVHTGNNGSQLVAYILPVNRTMKQSLLTRLKESLTQQLPEYMVPSYWIAVDELPRLLSGKLDRKRLPEPEAIGNNFRVPSTPQARALAEIWQEVLGVEQVGETDNFFTLGGDSLSSLKVIARIRNLKHLNLNIKLRDLMQKPTIASLLGLTDQQATTGLLILNQPVVDSDRHPLFCIHAGLGTVFDYQPLARYLQEARTVYGLPCRMLADPAHQDVSLHQMAQDYCALIRTVQPEGPVHLAGWSLGGTLAILMSEIFEAKRQPVAFLGLIDPYIPGVELSQSDSWQQDLADFVTIVAPGVAPDSVLSSAFAYSPETDATKQVVTDILDAAFTSQSGTCKTTGYVAMGTDELASVFLVARRLKMLSLQIERLEVLNTNPVCWWASDREQSHRAALAQQITPAKIHSFEIEAGHFEIIRADLLLQGIGDVLMQARCDSIESGAISVAPVV
ncbi:non-ribosomal peptide synthase domain TIGR01720/amino acid adenylation domain-containing protein [Nitrosomonas sp. PY1]|nr:non-ribosomal peptide synthase domain TIGR01720/amino acid adenylation domain-containing protein [Nitrosomonas sp. PY1]